jgi:hypothetical protein
LADVQTQTQQTVIFLHIPRTAGTTLNRIIDRHYRKDFIYTLWIDGSLDVFKELNSTRRSEIRVLRGHAGFGLHKFVPGTAAYFTILRNPIERAISYYYFIRRTPHHYCYDLATSDDMDLKGFLESKADPMADNAQTRLIAGLETGQEIGFGECTEELLEAAKRNLRENISVVGLTEEFDTTLLLLRKAFGWQRLFYARQNVSVNRPPKRALSQATLHAITDTNTLDLKLYQYAQELFKEQVRQQEASFANEVAAFQAANQRLSPLTRVIWEARKVSIRASVRKLITRISS